MRYRQRQRRRLQRSAAPTHTAPAFSSGTFSSLPFLLDPILNQFSNSCPIPKKMEKNKISLPQPLQDFVPPPPPAPAMVVPVHNHAAFPDLVTAHRAPQQKKDKGAAGTARPSSPGGQWSTGGALLSRLKTENRSLAADSPADSQVRAGLRCTRNHFGGCNFCVFFF